MIATRTAGSRPWLPLALVLVLLVAGLGRGWASAAAVPDVIPTIPGVTVHICHADGSDGSTPDGPGQHDCCDACALCAPVFLPGGPGLSAPARVIHFVRHTNALGWAPVLVRPRTPRLAQGPPDRVI